MSRSAKTIGDIKGSVSTGELAAIMISASIIPKEEIDDWKIDLSAKGVSAKQIVELIILDRIEDIRTMTDSEGIT